MDVRQVDANAEGNKGEMILLSSHIDRVIQDFRVSYKKGVHRGLLDNFAGVLLTYLAIYDDPMLAEFEKRGWLKVFHNTGEEWGELVKPPKITKHDVVICVDVWCMPSRYDFSLDNLYGFTRKELNEIRDCLVWEGFRPLLRRYTGDEDEHDESWEWHRKAGNCLTFSIPIQAKNDGWHRIQMDNTVTYDVMKTARQGLKRLIGGPLAAYLET